MLQMKKNIVTVLKYLSRNLHDKNIKIAPIIQDAVKSRKPVIALESTILTHGLPFKEAIDVSRELEQISLQAGVLSATVGILEGNLIVGMTLEEQAALINAAGENKSGKAALKDIPFILSGCSKIRNYGTTVSATLFASHKAGIPVFATGGIGGVHRGADTTFDISSDLTALAKFPVAVVCAGIKSILDISKTLELLETLSVTVVTDRTDEFPAFFTPYSGIRSPMRIEGHDEAANILKMIRDVLKLNQGLLIAIPNTSTSAEFSDKIEEAIKKAVSEATKRQIKGAEVTPFILEQVRQLTANKSFEANVSLIRNNVLYACELSKLYSDKKIKTVNENLLVIGGSNIDHTIKISQENINSVKDLSPPGSFIGEVLNVAPGGVGRNIADTLSKLGVPHTFLTALQKSDYDFLMKGINFESAMVKIQDRTASYVGVLNCQNDLLFGVADMGIHQRITPRFIEEYLKNQNITRVIIFDANISIETMQVILKYCIKNKVKTWLEPTDHNKVEKILHLFEKNPDLAPLTMITPNEFEFEKITKWKTGKEIVFDDSNKFVENIRKKMLEVSENILIKRGEKGIIFINKSEAYKISSPISKPKDIESVSGAGDSMVSAMLYARHHIGLDKWESCILLALRVAEYTMKSKKTVPEIYNLKELNENSVRNWAKERNIHIDHINP